MMKLLTLLYLVAAAPYEKPDTIPKVVADQATLGNILGVVYAIAGGVAVIFVVYGGIQYILSVGDSGKVKQAKDTILYALVGVVVVMLAFAITKYVIGAI